MASYGIISADSHFVEPPNMWAERLDKKFRDRAPHTVRGLNGKDGEFFVCQNINPFPVAAFFGAGVPSEQLPEHNKKGMEAASASVWDPAARFKDQDPDGVMAEVIYTSMGMPLYMLDDANSGPRVSAPTTTGRWSIAAIIPNGCSPWACSRWKTFPPAVQELERIAKKGMRGAMIWAEAPMKSRTTIRTMTRSGRLPRSQLPALAARPHRPERDWSRLLQRQPGAAGLHPAPRSGTLTGGVCPGWRAGTVP